MNCVIGLITISEAETGRLAAELSNYALNGDLFGLEGELGVGKSVFARAFIRALARNQELEVPSPTFTLVQTYPDLRITTSHFDLYRINDMAELDELGFEDAMLDGLAVIEWPDKITMDRFEDRLMISIEDNSIASRNITLSGFGSWRERLNRWQLSSLFLQHAGWGEDRRYFLQGDASHRRYERIDGGNRCAVLMDMPERSDGPVIRDGKTYSDLAHLAEGVSPFIAMTQALQSLGLSAPEIYASEPEQGFLLLEDLGTGVFFDMAAAGEDMTAPMLAAVDVLIHLSEKCGLPENQPVSGNHFIPVFDRTALQVEIELMPDWYWRRLKGEVIPDQGRQSFLDLWQSLWDHLENQPRIWMLRDFHSPNLLWLPRRTGVARVGLLDYQDAVLGPAAYDLVSLLQDARRDVSPQTERQLYEYYWRQVDSSGLSNDRQNFDLSYAILGAQRATKILGIFARLANRDNKPGYLAHIPRVRGYLERNLQHPRLKHLKSWFENHLPIEGS